MRRRTIRLRRSTNAAWARDDIDRFILAEAGTAQNLAPNAEADRAALLRRDFLCAQRACRRRRSRSPTSCSDTAPDAYEKQVDALLASPRFGERMALDWLDVARFADTYGYQSDNELFRLAVARLGDPRLQPEPAVRPIPHLADRRRPAAERHPGAAPRHHVQPPAPPDAGRAAPSKQEFRQEYVSDRVHTAGTAFLGLTMECSKCHDHKYDPLPQTDYYSMCAMFGQIDECGLYPYSLAATAPEPSMRLLEPAQGAPKPRNVAPR